MKILLIEPTFESWRTAARSALQAELPPDLILWEERESQQSALFSDEPALSAPTGKLRVPTAFLDMAKRVACNRDPERWPLLYTALWRLSHGEPHLLEVSTDRLVHRLQQMDKAIRHDVHKMRAFARFREVPGSDPQWFVAWFEPQHHIVELNAPFFTGRFASMRWSILTPDRCAHWDGERVTFTPGSTRAAAPTADEAEDLWRTYYGHIFNPARIKLGAMRAEMPKHYWRNLPEADLIPSLVREASERVESMIARSEKKIVRDDEYSIAEPPAGATLAKLRAAALKCTACPLYKIGTQTVFGEGPEDAEVVLLGEQPGDQEDREGRPFVGPAGKMLDRALEEAGIDRSTCYVTNSVKHFKWEPRGKRRIHAKPGAREIAACRPWAEAELARIQPKMLICLGATATQFVFGSAAKVTKDRGHIRESQYGKCTLITVHPSSLLRQPDEESRHREYANFVADLKVAAKAMRR